MADIGTRTKVFIIGAGISGLGCAEALNARKDLLDVTVLEARSVRIQPNVLKFYLIIFRGLEVVWTPGSLDL